MNKKILFFSLTVLIIITFSFLAFDPPEVVIIGPEFHEQEYFIEELNIIADELGIKIKYESVSDAETFIICLLYTSPSPRDYAASRMPSSA